MAVLLIATAGGHLSELVELAPRLGVDLRDATWVTFDTPQSRSLLAGRDVRFVDVVRSRDALGTLRATRRASSILGERRWECIVTTGAAIAAAFMPLARLRGIPTHYVESAARTTGPSVTGRIAHALPGVHCYTQYAQWSSRSWHAAGNVFDNFQLAAAPSPPAQLRRLLVTVGTMPFPFDRLIARLDAILPPDVDVTWQLGGSRTVPSRGTVVTTIGADELRELHRQADAVVAHAGVGSALMALDTGRVPILVPRLERHGEHVDDHQIAIAEHLAARGLARMVDAGELTLADLDAVAAGRAERVAVPPPIVLR